MTTEEKTRIYEMIAKVLSDNSIPWFLGGSRRWETSTNDSDFDIFCFFKGNTKNLPMRSFFTKTTINYGDKWENFVSIDNSIHLTVISNENEFKTLNINHA